MLKNLLNQTLIAGFIVLFLPMTAIAGGYVELPRHYGMLQMGMSEKDFISLTDVTPNSCMICIKNETFATLSGEQMNALDADSDGADVFFYEQKLYLISVGTTAKDFIVVNEEFENELGGPGKKEKIKGDNAKLKWEDPNTIITLNYNAKNKHVFSVNFYDWDLKQERDWRESQLLDQSKLTPTIVVIDQ